MWGIVVGCCCQRVVQGRLLGNAFRELQLLKFICLIFKGIDEWNNECKLRNKGFQVSKKIVEVKFFFLVFMIMLIF